MGINKIQMYYLQNNINQVVHDIINVVLDNITKYGVLNFEFEVRYNDKFFINNDNKLVQFKPMTYKSSLMDEFYEIIIRTKHIPIKELGVIYSMSIEGMIIDTLKNSIISDLIDDAKYIIKTDDKDIIKPEVRVIKLTLKPLTVSGYDN